MNRKEIKERRQFLLNNLLKGLFYLVLLVGVFLLLRQFSTEDQRYAWFGSIYDNAVLVISLFVLSEIFFGIIPPEVFMLWSLETGMIGPYFFSIAILSLISYGAGFLNFNIGRWIRDKNWINRARFPRLKKYMRLFEKFGGYLVVVASLTPLPFSAISLLSGIGGLLPRKYLLLSLFRILRYFLYALILSGIDTL
ncbi:VTT domain-containing protein [Cyclobacterium salsum]|uniref:VTT domain-containing protein n=1 Tax=Cyclobacterium salsum TaxID=2666329 RepID=UPI001391625D|nr:VTT domain-containing protein [Cyclobacterium salsum]